ncbi:MAG: type II secretion system protein J [Syntrophobacteraceae bacterium]
MRNILHSRLNTYGFTLIELIMATAISAIVIGILSVCLSFALRAWESTQNRKPDQTVLLVDLLKRQLAEFDPTPIKLDNGTRPLFLGEATSIEFATTHSIKAVSQGVPVVARYTFDKGSVLYYSETVLNPYQPKSIQEFLNAKISRSGKTKYRFFEIDMAEFVLAYAGKDSAAFSESWHSDNEIPIEVLLKWTGKDARAHSQILMVNTPFTIEVQKTRVPTTQGGAIQDD